jgi:hypothetical protein
MSVPKSEPSRLPKFLSVKDREWKNYAFTAQKLGGLSTLQRPMPTVDKTPPRLAQ